MRCSNTQYCAMERGHEGVCLDGAALTAATLSAEVERLREALTDILRVAYKGSAAASFARAALAGTPSETRTETSERIARRIESLLSTPCATPDFLEGVRRAAQRVRAGHLTTVVDAVSEPVETRRALAERVREACAVAVETSTNTTVAASYARAVRALDIDALLEER